MYVPKRTHRDLRFYVDHNFVYIDSPTMKIIQISDVHLDLSYTIGSNAGCDLPNCCMNVTGFPDSDSDAAQYWGDYRLNHVLIL